MYILCSASDFLPHLFGLLLVPSSYFGTFFAFHRAIFSLDWMLRFTESFLPSEIGYNKSITRFKIWFLIHLLTTLSLPELWFPRLWKWCNNAEHTKGWPVIQPISFLPLKMATGTPLFPCCWLYEGLCRSSLPFDCQKGQILLFSRDFLLFILLVFSTGMRGSRALLLTRLSHLPEVPPFPFLRIFLGLGFPFLKRPWFIFPGWPVDLLRARTF